MSAESRQSSYGHVASLHVHPTEPGAPLSKVESVEMVADRGIVGDTRYFSRISSSTGKHSRRQVSLIECEQIAGHAATLGLETIAPGTVRANIETSGIDLVKLVGRQVMVGEAVLHFYEARKPCPKMDAAASGLRQMMENGRQGVMAQVVRGGRVSIGDPVALMD
jgi:MOSC domain-containing protein YiiM